jgi:CTP-dependent riboflavin kinase
MMKYRKELRLAEENSWVLKGTIVSGVKEGAFFTRLDWVQEQCREKLGFSPYPGTLNLELSSKYLPVIEGMQKLEGIELNSPDPAFCSAKTLPVKIEGVSGAIIIPAEEVRVHGKNIVEIIAPLGLRELLDVTDGDSVTVVVNP